MTKDPYRHADVALYALFAMMSREFQNLGSVLRTDMSEAEVRQLVKAMYKRMGSRVEHDYRAVAERVRADTEKELEVQQKKRWAVGAFLLAILRAYDPVTKYVFTAEWGRKRERLIEGLMASEGSKQQIRAELKRGLDVLSLQVRQYADNVTDMTRLEVFRIAGVPEVRWNTQHDEKVCAICAERDQEIYEIDSIPEKHYRCRCYLTAVGKREEI